MHSFQALALVTTLLAVASSTSASRIIKKREVAPYASFDYCTPSQSCWPSASSWSAFNQTIGGRLIEVSPWAAPCYPGKAYNYAECAYIQHNYLDGFARSNAVGAMEALNWEDCLGENCWLLSILPQAPALQTCSLGRLSPFAVSVSSPDDVQKAVAFAHQNKIKLMIKNTGHEYVGRSSGPDGLTIWTHNLNSTSYSASWTPDSCSATAPITAITLGSGVQARHAYALAGENGKVITLGAYGSVGVAGGFAMGGGHGPLGPKYGLAVDNLRQFKIVTVDGQFRTVNACNDPDLFYALRGGGGGVWGVVTEVTYEVHPQTQIQHFSMYLSSAPIAGLLNQDSILQDFIKQLGKYAQPWADASGAGYTFIYPGTLGQLTNYTVDFGFPTTDKASVEKLVAPFVAHFKDNLNYKIGYKVGAVDTFDTLQSYVTGVLTAGESNTPVGFAEALSGRLLPKSLFTSDSSIASVASAIVKGKNTIIPLISAQTLINVIKPVAVMIYSTGPSNQPDNSKTGVNPAWRNELWEVVFGSGWTQDFPQILKDSFAQATHEAQNPLRDLTPGGGSYYSEADYMEDDWQTAFFGSNYAKLLSIKQKYDPENYLNVFKGVGWTGPDNKLYRCYKQA